jgi:hypothetical protein
MLDDYRDILYNPKKNISIPTMKLQALLALCAHSIFASRDTVDTAY